MAPPGVEAGSPGEWAKCTPTYWISGLTYPTLGIWITLPYPEDYPTLHFVAATDVQRGGGQWRPSIETARGMRESDERTSACWSSCTLSPPGPS